MIFIFICEIAFDIVEIKDGSESFDAVRVLKAFSYNSKARFKLF